MSFAPILAAGGAGLQGFAAIREGQANKATWDARQDELRRSAELERIAANESSTERLRSLQTTIGAQTAIFAMHGLNPDSPSGIAINYGSERAARTNIQREAFNAGQDISNAKLAARAAGISGRSALTAGYLKGVGSFFQAATDARSGFIPKAS